MNDFYLSYSSMDCYRTCPRKYEFRYIRKEKSFSNPRNTFFGLVIGQVFEWFYNEKIWKSKDPESSTLSLIGRSIKHISDKEKFDPQSDSAFFSELTRDLTKFIPPAIQNIRRHRLLSANTTAEHKLNVSYTGGKFRIYLGGRADFIHRFSDNDVWIIDGKGSKYKSKFVDYEQLVWYSVQYYLKYGVVPSRLGFFLYRFPDDPIKWVALDSDMMKSSVRNIENVSGKIKLKNFDPFPSDSCKLCDYSPLCPEGAKYIQDNKKSESVDVSDSMFDIDIF